MRKYLFCFALLTLLFGCNDASAQTTANPTNEQLKNQITELEKEIDELKNVDELKSDMQDSLLSKEKDNSSKIYNASIWFITVVGLFVAAGGIYLTYFSNKIAKHQKKINMVLDSKEFDRKVTDIEQRIANMRMREKMTRISYAKRQFRILCKEIEDIRSEINYFIEREGVNEILIKNNWDDTISSYPTVKEQFIDRQDIQITPLEKADDNENDYENIKKLESIIEELEGLLNVSEQVKAEISVKLKLDYDGAFE